VLIFYNQVLQFGRDMAENGRISPFVASWVPFIVFAVGSSYLFYVANSRFNRDPLATVFAIIDDSWMLTKRAWLSVFGRRRAA
jgi:hypothetical protein